MGSIFPDYKKPMSQELLERLQQDSELQASSFEEAVHTLETAKGFREGQKIRWVKEPTSFLSKMVNGFLLWLGLDHAVGVVDLDQLKRDVNAREVQGIIDSGNLRWMSAFNRVFSIANQEEKDPIQFRDWEKSWLEENQNTDQPIRFYPGLLLSVDEFKQLLQELQDQFHRNQINPFSARYDLSSCPWLTEEHLLVLKEFEPMQVDLTSCSQLRELDVNYFKLSVTTVIGPNGTTYSNRQEAKTINDWLEQMKVASRQGDGSYLKFPPDLEDSQKFYDLEDSQKLDEYQFKTKLLDRLKPIWKDFSLVKTIDLSSCKWVRKEHILELVERFPNLSSIKIEGCLHVTESDIPEEIDMNGWRDLCLQGNVLRVHPEYYFDPIKFAKFLQSAGKKQTVHEVDLSDCRWVREYQVIKIKENCPQLRSLNICGTPLQKEECARILGEKVQIIADEQHESYYPESSEQFDEPANESYYPESLEEFDEPVREQEVTDQESAPIRNYFVDWFPKWRRIYQEKGKEVVFDPDMPLTFSEFKQALEALLSKREIQSIDFSNCSWLTLEELKYLNVRIDGLKAINLLNCTQLEPFDLQLIPFGRCKITYP